MGIESLHNRLLSLFRADAYPPIGKHEVLAKNVFLPFNFLNIPKTKLKKIATDENMGDVFTFYHSKEASSSLFLYVSEFGLYGKLGTFKQEEEIEKALSNKETLTRMLSQMLEGGKEKDKVDYYIPKEITKIVKSIASNYSSSYDVRIVFLKNEIRAFIEPQTISYKVDVHGKLVGKELNISVKGLQSGVWKVSGDKIFDKLDKNISFFDKNEDIEMPIMPREHIVLSSKHIIKMADFAKTAIENNNPRYGLNFLLIEIENSMANFVATDTLRLAISKKFKVKGSDGKYFIHGRVLKRDTPISIQLAKGIVSVSYKGYRVIEKFDNESIYYPDYKKLNISDRSNYIKIDAKDLKGIKGKVYFVVKNNKAFIGKSLDENKLKPLSVKNIDCKNISLLLNAKLLEDSASLSKEVTIWVRDRNLPILIESEQGDSIIMPIPYKDTEDEKRKQANG